MRISDWSSDGCSSDLLRDLLDAGKHVEFFQKAVHGRKNILISGATGSGKTTLSKGLIQLIPPHERLLTIEDTRELVVPHRNVVHMLYAKDKQGTAKISAKDLLESALRMRPDRRSEEHTSELQSLMRISYAVFCLKKKNTHKIKRKTYLT